ncbi:MAG: glycosyltransferase [Anaerolineae bacterium]|nr:glycosyltransferase [Anaerolineae bacterium]
MSARLAAAVVFLLIGAFLMWDVRPVSRHRRRHGSGEERRPKVSVIIPARDEAGRIGRLLASLAQQSIPIHEVLVVDDESADDTARLARELGATVIAGQPLPDGWSGKPWACWQGAQQSSGDVLLFLDADTWLEPAGVEGIVGALRDSGGLVTVQPYHVTERAYEQLSAVFGIVVLASMNAFTPLSRWWKSSGGFGPCAATGREEYAATGGHAAVKAQVLEHLAMAKVFRRQGLPVACYSGRDAISYRMYPGGIGQLVEGWSKGFALGAAGIAAPSLILTVAWVWGCFSTFASLIRALVPSSGLPLWPWLALYVLYAAEFYWMLWRTGKFRWWTSALYPIPLTFFAAIMARSLVLTHVVRRVTWRGRAIRIRGRGGP